MLEKLGSSKSNYKAISQDDRSTTSEENTSLYRIAQRGGFRGQQRTPSGRGSRISRNNQNFQRRPSAKPKCKHCTWLKENWGIWEIDTDHDSRSCRRKMPAEVKLILQDKEDGPWSDEEDNETFVEEEPGQPLYKTIFQNNTVIFQKSEPKGIPVEDGLDKTMEQEPVKPPGPPTKKKPPVSDKDNTNNIKAIRDSSSPKIAVTFNHKNEILLVDEGSETNAGSGKFARRHKLKVIPSTRTAMGAGNNSLNIIGETEHDLVVDTRFGSRHVNINLGKIVIIEDLGSDLIMGEPGKSSNDISTDPSNKMIICRRLGDKMSKPYYDPEANQSTSPNICRILKEDVTIFPNSEITLDVPDHLQYQTLAITPRGDLNNIFPTQCRYVEDKIKLTNVSDLPVNLKKHCHVADIRSTKMIYPEELQHVNNEVRLVHIHDPDNFKYSPTVKQVEEPDTS